MKNSLIIFLTILILTCSFADCYRKVSLKNLRADGAEGDEKTSDGNRKGDEKKSDEAKPASRVDEDPDKVGKRTEEDEGVNRTDEKQKRKGVENPVKAKDKKNRQAEEVANNNRKKNNPEEVKERKRIDEKNKLKELIPEEDKKEYNK